MIYDQSKDFDNFPPADSGGKAKNSPILDRNDKKGNKNRYLAPNSFYTKPI